MSLLPTKHSHPDKTTIAIAAIIIKKLKKSRIEKYDYLLDFIVKKDPDSKNLFLPSINFLYLTGLVVYHSKNDSFEYTGL